MTSSSSPSSLPDFRTFLSTAILSDQQNVSYRSLSRALKCHVNIAKCLLYEYYEEQSKKKPGSVYATYLIAGTRTPAPPVETNGHSQVNGQKKEGEDGTSDDDMALPSSLPPFSSSMLEPSQPSQETANEATPPAPVQTVLLVREEDLETTKSQFEKITGLHIYSLSPGKIPDLVALTDIGRGLFADVFSKEDPLVHNKMYGVIQNKNVRRRKRRLNVPPPTMADKPKMQPVKQEEGKPKATATPSAVQAMTSKPTSSLKREETTSRPSSRDSTSTREDKKPTSKRDVRDIFKAFAKASSKAQSKVKEEPQDTMMADADDEEGESEEEALFLDTNTRKSGTKRESDVRKEREDKAAKLRKMMDSDDEEAEEGGKEGTKQTKTDATKKDAAAAAEDDKGEEEEEEEAVAWSDSDADDKQQQHQQQQPAHVPPAAGPRRKRGKRKVIQKRTFTDQAGFLVIKEEEVWQDFSETDNDEPKKPSAAAAPQPQPKKNFPAATTTPTTTKPGATSSQAKEKGSNSSGKAAVGKKTKGDIRGFFGKK